MGSPTKKGGKKKNPWETDSDESEDDENGVVSDSADGASDFADDPAPREKKARTASAPKSKNGYGSSDDEFDAMVKKETPEKKNGAGNGNANSDSDSEFGAPPPAKTSDNGNGFKHESDDGFDGMIND